MAGAEITTKWLGNEAKKRNEITDEEEKKKVRWGRCALAAEQGSLKMHADRESFTRQIHLRGFDPGFACTRLSTDSPNAQNPII